MLGNTSVQQCRGKSTRHHGRHFEPERGLDACAETCDDGVSIIAAAMMA